MPHDKDGLELAVGDRVCCFGKVLSVFSGETACNIEVAIEAAPGEYGPQITCNTKSFVKMPPIVAEDD